MNGMMEQLNHTICHICHILLVITTDHRHAVSADNTNKSRGIVLASNGVYIRRYPRFPMTVFVERGEKGHRGVEHDRIYYINLMRNKQGREYNLVRMEDITFKANHETSNTRLNAILQLR